MHQGSEELWKMHIVNNLKLQLEGFQNTRMNWLSMWLRICCQWHTLGHGNPSYQAIGGESKLFSVSANKTYNDNTFT